MCLRSKGVRNPTGFPRESETFISCMCFLQFCIGSIVMVRFYIRVCSGTREPECNLNAIQIHPTGQTFGIAASTYCGAPDTKIVQAGARRRGQIRLPWRAGPSPAQNESPPPPFPPSGARRGGHNRVGHICQLGDALCAAAPCSSIGAARNSYRCDENVQIGVCVMNRPVNWQRPGLCSFWTAPSVF